MSEDVKFGLVKVVVGAAVGGWLLFLAHVGGYP